MAPLNNFQITMFVIGCLKHITGKKLLFLLDYAQNFLSPIDFAPKLIKNEDPLECCFIVTEQPDDNQNWVLIQPHNNQVVMALLYI